MKSKEINRLESLNQLESEKEKMALNIYNIIKKLCFDTNKPYYHRNFENKDKYILTIGVNEIIDYEKFMSEFKDTYKYSYDEPYYNLIKYLTCDYKKMIVSFDYRDRRANLLDKIIMYPSKFIESISHILFKYGIEFELVYAIDDFIHTDNNYQRKFRIKPRYATFNLNKTGIININKNLDDANSLDDLEKDEISNNNCLDINRDFDKDTVSELSLSDDYLDINGDFDGDIISELSSSNKNRKECGDNIVDPISTILYMLSKFGKYKSYKEIVKYKQLYLTEKYGFVKNLYESIKSIVPDYEIQTFNKFDMIEVSKPTDIFHKYNYNMFVIYFIKATNKLKIYGYPNDPTKKY